MKDVLILIARQLQTQNFILSAANKFPTREREVITELIENDSDTLCEMVEDSLNEKI